MGVVCCGRLSFDGPAAAAPAVGIRAFLMAKGGPHKLPGSQSTAGTMTPYCPPRGPIRSVLVEEQAGGVGRGCGGTPHTAGSQPALFLLHGTRRFTRRREARSGRRCRRRTTSRTPSGPPPISCSATATPSPTSSGALPHPSSSHS